MRYPELSARQRIKVAQLSGTVERLAAQGGQWAMSDLVAVVHEVSEDPLVLGQVLGAYLVRKEELPHFDPILQVLRAAGADEQRAAEVAAWQRWRLDRTARSEGRPIL